MRKLRRAGLFLAFVTALVGPVAAGGAAATPQWAPAATAPIHPGVQTFTQGAQCTANFVFFDAAAVYIGQAAHCSGTGSTTDTDGCTAGSYPVGTEVAVGGATHPATMVYNSWLTMQALHETDPDTCQFNDLALLRLDPSDVPRVNPSIPFWGGPVALNTTGTAAFQQVYSYGNSALRLGLGLLSPKRGLSLGDEGGGWSHTVETFTPGVPGDSGSAFLDAKGAALGILSTLDVGIPGGLTNGVGDLAHELAYLHQHTGFTGVQLALGTTPFAGNRLPLGL